MVEAPRQLYVWALYDHPSDCPDMFVSRKFVVQEGGLLFATQEYVACRTLEKVHQTMLSYGLRFISRSPEDEPHCLGSYL